MHTAVKLFKSYLAPKRKSLLKVLKSLFFVVLSLLIIFFGLVWFPWSPIGFPEKEYTQLLIENITIVDVENDTIYEGRFVLIADHTIQQIADEPIRLRSKGLERIDGSRKFLVPAFWDMHVHLGKRAPLSAHAEFVVNGVMHVRDMRGAYNDRDHFATTPERITAWNKEIDERTLLGPKTHNITSFAVEGPHAMFDGLPDFFNCSNAQEARRLVDYFEAQGVDLIKLYNNIPREAFFELMEKARKAGIDVAGHKPLRISTVEASDAGMKSLEHARFLIWDSYSRSEALRNSEDPRSQDNTDRREQMLCEHDSVLLHKNLETLRNNQTWYCPTHLTRKSDADADASVFRARYNRINPLLRFLSYEDLDGTIQEDPTPRGRKVYQDFYLKSLEITGKAHQQGVRILAGSDVPELPGTSLLDELEELSGAGLANFEVLKTATLHPAQYYRVEKQYGTIEAGKRADMIILARNPIADIKNVRSIHGLIYQGHYLDKDKIDGIKETIYSRNNGIVMSAKLIWDILLYTTL